MNAPELEGVKLALLVVGATDDGETDARVWSGTCRCIDGRVVLDRGADNSAITLQEEWLPRIKEVPEQVQHILKGATHVVRLSIGPLPDGASDAVLVSGLRWVP